MKLKQSTYVQSAFLYGIYSNIVANFSSLIKSSFLSKETNEFEGKMKINETNVLESIELQLIESDHREQLLLETIFVHGKEIDHEFSLENLHPRNSSVFLLD